MEKVKVEKISDEEILKRNISSWPVWTKEISRFSWTYSGDEECLILEGEFVVETDVKKYKIGPGDFVTFRNGLQCIWDISSPVKKHYNFP